MFALSAFSCMKSGGSFIYDINWDGTLTMAAKLAPVLRRAYIELSFALRRSVH